MVYTLGNDEQEIEILCHYVNSFQHIYSRGLVMRKLIALVTSSILILKKRLMYLMIYSQLPIHRLWLLLALSPQEIMLKEICPVSFWNLSRCNVFEGMDRNYALCKKTLNPSHVEHAKTVEDCHRECEVFQNLDSYIVGYNINSIWIYCARWKTQ